MTDLTLTDSRVAVIGAGTWGTTIAKMLGDNGRDVLLWARRRDVMDEINREHTRSDLLPGQTLPDGLRATQTLEDVAHHAKLLFVALPSQAFRTVVRALGPHTDGEHVLVHATKGLEARTFKRMSEIVREETPIRRIGVLTGPNLGPQVAAGLPAGALIASRYDGVIKRVYSALHRPTFRLYGWRDVVGAEVAGAFKNVVAIAAGIADGLALGENAKALLITRGLNEMSRFGQLLGAEVLTFGTIAAVGDLFATCTSPLSRNHTAGWRLAEGATIEELGSELDGVAEGLVAASVISEYAHTLGISLPLVAATRDVIAGDAPPHAILDQLIMEDADSTGLSL